MVSENYWFKPCCEAAGLRFSQSGSAKIDAQMGNTLQIVKVFDPVKPTPEVLAEQCVLFVAALQVKLKPLPVVGGDCHPYPPPASRAEKLMHDATSAFDHFWNGTVFRNKVKALFEGACRILALDTKPQGESCVDRFFTENDPAAVKAKLSKYVMNDFFASPMANNLRATAYMLRM